MNTLVETKAGAYALTIISMICNLVLIAFNIYFLYCIIQTKKNTDEILKRMGNGNSYRKREQMPKTIMPTNKTPITSSAKNIIDTPAGSTTIMPTAAATMQLTQAEKEYLSLNVLEPYGRKVEGITKHLDYKGNKYYLELRLQESGKLRFVNLNPMVDDELFSRLKTGEYKTMTEFGYTEEGGESK